MNIYQMYAANGNRCGFYVRRDSWSHPETYALVLTIDGKEEGPLPGFPPYHKNAGVSARIWYQGKPAVGRLSCAGSHAYSQIPFRQ